MSGEGWVLLISSVRGRFFPEQPNDIFILCSGRFYNFLISKNILIRLHRFILQNDLLKCVTFFTLGDNISKPEEIRKQVNWWDKEFRKRKKQLDQSRLKISAKRRKVDEKETWGICRICFR